MKNAVKILPQGYLSIHDSVKCWESEELPSGINACSPEIKDIIKFGNIYRFYRFDYWGWVAPVNDNISHM